MQTAQRSPAVGPARRGSSPFRLRAGRHASPLSRPAFALDLDEDELLYAPGDRDARIRALEEDLERSVFGTAQHAAVVSPSNGGDEGNGDSVPLHVTIRTRSNSISSALTDVDFSSNANPRASDYDQEPEESKPDQAIQQPNSPRPCPRTASKYNAMLVSKNGSPAAKDTKKARPTKAKQVYKHASKYDAMRTAKRGPKYDAMPALQKAKHFHPSTTQSAPPSNAVQQKLADAKKTKHEAIQFTKVLMKYLKKHDPAMYKKAMAAIKECHEKHKAGDPRFASLTASYRVRLRKVVGRSHWLKANYHFGRFLETGGKENKEAQENSMQRPSTASATPVAQPITSTAAAARTNVHLGKRKAPPKTLDVAAPKAKRMKEEEKVRKMAHLEWERDADVASLAMLTEKEKILEDDLEAATRLRNELLSQITAGTRVEVYWPRYDKPFPGTVTACHRTIDQFGGRHQLFGTIHYDDGDIETADLSRTTFRIVGGKGAADRAIALKGVNYSANGAYPAPKPDASPAQAQPADDPPTVMVSLAQRRNEILSRITVGMWIAIYWPLDEKFYPGIVASDYDPDSQYTGGNHLYTILYDDGQQEKLDLSQETFHILDV